jgi:hypothetical protein
MPADRELVLQKLNLLRRAVMVELEHAEVLRAGVDDDDLEAIQRGLRGLANARELVSDLAIEIGRELPARQVLGIREAPDPRTSTDGYLGAVEP